MILKCVCMKIGKLQVEKKHRERSWWIVSFSSYHLHNFCVCFSFLREISVCLYFFPFLLLLLVGMMMMMTQKRIFVQTRNPFAHVVRVYMEKPFTLPVYWCSFIRPIPQYEFDIVVELLCADVAWQIHRLTYQSFYRIGGHCKESKKAKDRFN